MNKIVIKNEIYKKIEWIEELLEDLKTYVKEEDVDWIISVSITLTNYAIMIAGNADDWKTIKDEKEG